MIKTKPGSLSRDGIEEAITRFPNAMYILGIGVCYAMDDQKYKFGDVLISNAINHFENTKRKTGGKIIPRGETRYIFQRLYAIFCDNRNKHDPLLVTNERYFKAFPGTFVCSAELISDSEMKEEMKIAVPEAIGGEMEGGELLKFINKNNNIKGIIIIKGVADYGDEKKSDQWQFMAAMAAFKYAESKLSNETNLQLDDEDM